ncbi:hypothetical protein [Sorangium sp. So ce1099]|uniref:hypothetical protein n=1 Tax=Sorangium sp. So ce1099 TaxID=3133331 RepID=UPI003F631B43
MNQTVLIVSVIALVLVIGGVAALALLRRGSVDASGSAGPLKLGVKAKAAAPQLGAEMKAGHVKDSDLLNQGAGHGVKLETGNISGSKVVNTSSDVRGSKT